MLDRKGWSVNLKRVHRLWIELGLRRPMRRKKPEETRCQAGRRGQQLRPEAGPIQERCLDMRFHS